MKQELVKQLEAKFIKKLPKFDIGDTIAVSTIIREGDKTRVQIFRGIIIAIKGAGISKTFTIRKISTAGVGVEKIIPFNSPNISKVVVIKKGTVRKSKLYYMRKRIGKRALKITEGVMDTEIAADVIETPTDVTEKVAEDGQAAEAAK